MAPCRGIAILSTSQICAGPKRKRLMPLVSLRNVSFTFTDPTLLDGIELDIDRGERIGLVGRNGAGKSTLMRIIAGQLEPDAGEVRLQNGVRVARLVQEVPGGGEETVAEIVAGGLEEQGGHDWEVEQAVKRALSQMSLDGSARFATLSSGMKRRTLLARALAGNPDVLLLDEPTNHLDIESITWLEKFLTGYDAALVFVTHDRVFLQSLATRIVEVDRGRLFDWSCDYQTFLKRKVDALAAEEKQNRLFDKRLAQEEVWIRQGVLARRTRNEGRVAALNEMRNDRRQRRRQLGNVRMQAIEAQRSGRLVIEATDVSFGYDEQMIVDDFETLVTRGEKIGIIGPNGAGKTTLLKVLLGELEPTGGSLRHGSRLEVIYFDQMREQIDEEATVLENVGEGQELLMLGGRRRHIYGYLQDFLFTPERARQQAKFLSGGERNRLLLARLFKRPSNLMVLDEPTNDLDTETLELLEELVADYTGTLLLVSHDRAFLNNVVTSTLAFEGQGQVKQYDGGYDDYRRQREASVQTDVALPKAKKKPKPSEKSQGKPARLTYKEKFELQSIPHQIEELEQEQAELHTQMADPSFFKQDPPAIAEANARLTELDATLAELFARWEDLESQP